ncbi:MAG: 7TM diverse intracellular signaling domain-containing protein [Cytophagales bacterium]
MKDFKYLRSEYQNILPEKLPYLPDSAFETKHPNFSLKGDKGYWLKLEIDFESDTSQQWVMEVFNSKAAQLVVAHVNPNLQLKYVDTIGIDTPFYERNITARVPSFLLEHIHKGKNTIYVYYKPFYFSDLNIEIKPYVEFSNYYYRYNFLIGGFCIVLAFLMFYNLMFYFASFDKIYLSYIFFAFTATLDCLTFDQTGFALLWPNWCVINRILVELVRPLFILGFIVYAGSFLSIRKDFKTIHNSIWLVYGCYLIQQLLKFYTQNTFTQSLVVSEIFIFYILFSLLYVTIIRLNNGDLSNWTFLGGFLVNLIGIAVTYGFYHGIVAGNFFVYYIMFYSISIDTVLFSFAQSVRFKKERTAKEKALTSEAEAQALVIAQMQENELLLQKVNRELEQRVYERTLEIELSKSQIAQQAEVIKQMNVALDKENYSLNKTIKSLELKRIIPERLSFAEFKEKFASEMECYIFVKQKKWPQGFVCGKCGNSKEASNADFYTCRCSKCGTIESITAHTIFHKLKFPIDKAFYLVYAIFIYKDEMNLSNISKEIDLNYKTCIKFKQRIENAFETQKMQKGQVKSWDEIIVDI